MSSIKKKPLRINRGDMIWVRCNVDGIWHPATFDGFGLAPGKSVYNLKNCIFKWCYREDIVTEKPATQFLYTYDKGDGPQFLGAFSDEQEAQRQGDLFFHEMNEKGTVQKRRQVVPNRDSFSPGTPWLPQYDVASYEKSYTFLVRKNTDGQESTPYCAWPSAEGYAFTINDGRVPGSVNTLPYEDFWKTFVKAD